MNCVELQQSLAEVEDGSSVEQRAHLRVCPACSALVRDLNLIAAAASELQAADEPSPRVWNSIEIALRQEGLIRPQRGGAAACALFWRPLGRGEMAGACGGDVVAGFGNLRAARVAAESVGSTGLRADCCRTPPTSMTTT